MFAFDDHQSLLLHIYILWRLRSDIVKISSFNYNCRGRCGWLRSGKGRHNWCNRDQIFFISLIPMTPHNNLSPNCCFINLIFSCAAGLNGPKPNANWEFKNKLSHHCDTWIIFTFKPWDPFVLLHIKKQMQDWANKSLFLSHRKHVFFHNFLRSIL